MDVPDNFNFPFEPYSIQNDFMKELYKSLDSGKLGIFESPTGTGKSLSLCCGALKWLQDYETAELLSITRQIENLKLSVQSNDADEDWLSVEYEKIQKTSEMNMLKKKLENITKYKEKIDDLRSKKRTQKVVNKSKWFNEKKKQSEDIQSSDNKLDEKNLDDLPLDDADLLLDETTPEIDDIDDAEIEEDVDDGSLKIFFCSRTHSQLSQFVNEIKRTEYSSEIRVVSLASRQQYCINPEVQKLKSSHLVNERCLDLQKGKKGKTTKVDDGKVTKRSKCSSGCQFFNQTNIELLRDEALTEIRDVEDLVSAGKEVQSCPYYSARAAIRFAQVVVVPYQTLLHEATRRANGITLKNNVVIIDEAHNLLDTIEHIHCAEVSGFQLQTASDKLKHYREKYRSRFAAKNLLYLNQVIFVIGKILGLLKLSEKNNQTVTEERRIFTLEEFVLTAEIDNYNLRPILNFCNQSKLAQKLHGFSERYPIASAKEDKKSTNNKQHLQSFLAKISDENKKGKKKPAPEVNILEEEQLPMEKYVSVGNVIQSVIGFLERLTSSYADGRISTYKTKNVDNGFHKFILLNPATQFTDIVKDARAIILAGGTMQPFSEFRDQLFLSAGATVDRIMEFSCGHVIPPDNILPICLSEGPSGKKLNFSYEMRNSPEMLNELGRILQNVCNVVPGGVVCFFPSYDYEKMVFGHLKSSGVLDKIENKKKIFREPKTTGQVEQVLGEYSKVIRSKNTKFTGALMFSVVGGKLSEGLNFSDDLGRCVIVVGMPYPNIKSVELKEKMKFLNENVSATAGNTHYENLCLKAVNQCIGRAVRHAKDYATVILVDERYSRENVSNSLPKWIQEIICCWSCDRDAGLVENSRRPAISAIFVAQIVNLIEMFF